MLLDIGQELRQNRSEECRPGKLHTFQRICICLLNLLQSSAVRVIWISIDGETEADIFLIETTIELWNSTEAKHWDQSITIVRFKNGTYGPDCQEVLIFRVKCMQRVPVLRPTIWKCIINGYREVYLPATSEVLNERWHFVSLNILDVQSHLAILLIGVVYGLTFLSRLHEVVECTKMLGLHLVIIIADKPYSQDCLSVTVTELLLRDLKMVGG